MTNKELVDLFMKLPDHHKREALIEFLSVSWSDEVDIDLLNAIKALES